MKKRKIKIECYGDLLPGDVVMFIKFQLMTANGGRRISSSYMIISKTPSLDFKNASQYMLLRLTSTEFQGAPGSVEDHTYVNDGLLVGPNSIGWSAEVVR